LTLQNVFVIGAGAWGTALSQAAAMAGREVTLFARDRATASEINRTHRNSTYLGDQPLSPRIVAQAHAGGLSDADIVLVVVPAQQTRSVLEAIGGEALAGKPVVLCAKGLERGTLDRQSQILADVTPDAIPLVLSGPSFAADVASGRPTAVTLAGSHRDVTDKVAQALAGPGFRPYAAGDLMGVELAGALKNIYALASGAVEGADLGFSARAALIARAFAEMTRLVTAMGGNAATLTGLAGLGDLTLTCTTAQSRNYMFGLALGRGDSVETIKAHGAKLAEGLSTAPVAMALARKYGVDAPLIGAVNLLLEQSLDINEIVAGLMSRPLKREGED
jgi:glycerol-3-phosphate dehydrogenase (NAD(P)+)